MKPLALAAASAILLGLTGSAAQFGPAHLTPVLQPSPRAEQPRASYVHIETHPPRYAIAPEALTEVVHRVCGMCHNDAAKTGNLSLEKFDVALANRDAETAEKMIRKLRAGMMPPPGSPRPGGDTLHRARRDARAHRRCRRPPPRPNPATARSSA